MGTIFHGMLLFYFISVLRSVISQDCSTFPIDRSINFDETAKNGSVIYTSNYTNTTTQDWTATDNWTTGASLVQLTFENGTYTMILRKEFDYDVSPCQSGTLEYRETFSCPVSNGPPITETVQFIVNRVNEFPPVAEKNRKVPITEGDLTGPKYVDDLKIGITDRDCPREAFTFNITAVAGETDASSYFMINETEGYLYQIKSFDHEQSSIQCGVLKEFGEFNLIIQNYPFNVTENIRVRFIDTDDTPPVFVLPQCDTTCYNCPTSNITTVINYTDQGMIGIDKIKAVDPDTPTPNITYSTTVTPPKYEDVIMLDNGTLYIVESFANFSNNEETSDFEVNIMIQAENRLGIMSVNFTVFLNVTVPVTTTPEPTTEPTTTPPTTTEEMTTQTTTTPTPSTTPPPPVTVPSTTPAPTTTPPMKSPDPDKSSDTNVLVIVLPIIGVLVLIILFVIVYKVRKGQPQVKYNLEKDQVNRNTGSAEMKEREFSTEAENPAYVNENGNV